MPANPDHIQRREVISEDYHDEKVTVDFYTNSAVRIYRGDEDDPEKNVWLDNLEKRVLVGLLNDEVSTDRADIDDVPEYDGQEAGIAVLDTDE